MTKHDYRAMCAELVDAIFTPNPYNWEDSLYEAANRARALLDQPVAEGPTDEEIADWHGQCVDLTRLREADHYWAFDLRSDEVAGVVRAAIARWGRPTPQPVAVSERLPGPEDCLDEGWAWFFNQRIGWRQAVLPVSTGYTHWLPANALPTPEAKP